MAICSYLTGDNSVGSGWCITAPACFDLKTSHSCLAFSTRQKKCLNTAEIYGPPKHNAATPYVVKSNTCQDLVLFWGSQTKQI